MILKHALNVLKFRAFNQEQHCCRTLPRHNGPKVRPRNDPGAHWDFQKRQKQKNNTQDSNVVPHRSTN